MATSLRYAARRSTPLTADERRAIARIIEQYSVEERIHAFGETAWGANWESFVVYDPDDPSEPDVIFEGATEVRDHPAEHTLAVLRHWCAALSALRRALPDAAWDVRAGDRPIRWDAAAEAFDPSV
jgi:hypothetical protein